MRLTEKLTDGNYKVQCENLYYYGVSKDKRGNTTYTGEHIDKLAKYENLGYTPEELQLCLNPPEVMYIIGEETDGEKVRPIYPVDAEQIEIVNSNVYWNCRDNFGDRVEIPLNGLGSEYFLSVPEAVKALYESEINSNLGKE
jgi:hypothetical protein